MRSVKPRGAWVVGLCAVAALAVPASAGAITSAECAARVNDTPGKLVECIQQGDLSAHMDNLQAIANANPGPDGHPSRNSGEPGYKASADYVAQKMQDAGYDVHLQNYKFDYYAYTGIPTMSVGGTDLVLGVDWGPGQSLGSMDGQTLTAVKQHRPPADDDPELGGGCAPGDFGPEVAAIRPDPARHLHLRPEGRERTGGGRHGRDHLQRGQHGPGPHRPAHRQPGAPVHPDDPRRVRDVRDR